MSPSDPLGRPVTTEELDRALDRARARERRRAYWLLVSAAVAYVVLMTLLFYWGIVS